MEATIDIAAVFDRHVDTVYRVCFSMLQNAADAEDATQATFLKLLDHPRTFDGTEHERAWLIVCAKNLCRDVLKSAARTRVSTLDDEAASQPVGTDGREEEARSDERNDLARAIGQLPEMYQEVVFLYYHEGLKTDEIAQVTGSPPSTVRNRLRDARKILKELLEGGRP